MSLQPFGIFWDIENCCIPKNMTPNDCISQLRDFIINKFNNNCVEYMFCCACHTKLLDDSITKSLNQNGVDIVDVNTNSKIDANEKLRENIEKFVDHYGFDSIVVIITDDIHFCRSIRSARRKEVTVLLICGNNTSQQLISSVDQSVTFDQIFGLNDCVIVAISNLPVNKSRKTISRSLASFCDAFNCKFRPQKKGFAKFIFNCFTDAERAVLELKNREFFGQQLKVEYEETYSRSSSSNSSVFSSHSSVIPPQNDDNCKSVVIGLFTKKNDNVLQMVRNIIKNWKEEDITEDMIYRVNRERDFAGRDGKATLIVTAINAESNNKLLSVAKIRFFNREKKIYWNRLRRSVKEITSKGFEFQSSANTCHQLSNQKKSIVMREVSDTFKSIIIGLWTSHDENVLKLIRNLVKSWDVFDLNPNHIISVDRSKRFYKKDGKAPLIVTTDSDENNEKLLKYALKKFINKKNKFFWKTLEVKQFDEKHVKQTNRFENKVFSSGSVSHIF